MNILFLHSSSDIYGASKILLYSIQALKKKVGSSSKMFVILSEKGPLVMELEKIGCHVIIFDLAILRKKYNNLPGIINRLFKLIQAFFYLLKLIKRNRIELIYSNTTAVVIGAIVSLFCPAKHVFHVHEIVDSPRHLKVVLSFLMLHASDINIMVSGEVLKNWAKTEALLEKSKIVYNGINVEEEVTLSNSQSNDLPSSKHLIGMIGRVHYWKGQSYFLKIANEVKKEIDDIKFVMIGDAYPGYEYLYSDLEKIKKELHLEDDVIDLGFQSNPNCYLKKFDALILPSTQPDPFPTVILEAMALEVPVIATSHGGALEMIDSSVTGYHIPPDDHVKAGKIIASALKNAGLKGMGAEGKRKLMQEFSLQAFENNISQEILNVV